MNWWTVITILAPIVPTLIHAFGLDTTPVGRVIVALFPDLIGAAKKLAPAPADP